MEFQGLYGLAVDPVIFVVDALRSNPPVVAFRRQLSPVQLEAWVALCRRVVGIGLTGDQDKVTWYLVASGKFSVKSLYARMPLGPDLVVARGLWKARIPLKVKIFLWQMFRNRLPTSDNVARCNGPSDGNCSVCGAPEDAKHALFRCHLPVFVWSVVRAAAGLDWNPLSGVDLLTCLGSLSGQTSRVMWTCVGALLWLLWHIRNKITIEGVFPSHPADCVLKCTIFL